MVEPQLGHGGGVGIVDHNGRQFDVTGELFQCEPGVAHDLAEGNGCTIGGDDTLHGIGDAEHLAAGPYDLTGEFRDQVADHIVVIAVVAVCCAFAPAHNDVAVKIHRHHGDGVCSHGDADCRVGLRFEHEGLCLASTG